MNHKLDPTTNMYLDRLVFDVRWRLADPDFQRRHIEQLEMLKSLNHLLEGFGIVKLRETATACLALMNWMSIKATPMWRALRNESKVMELWTWLERFERGEL